jgi:hypothetical protein
MSKFWIMGGAAIAVSVAAIGWNCRPAHSSNPLLGKAQSEFATRARDALIQRRMAQIPVTSEVALAPVVPATAPVVPVIPDTLAVASEASLAPERTYVVASLEPVAPPANSFAKSPDTSVASQPPAADSVKAQPSEVLASEPVAPSAPPEVAATEQKPATEIEAEAPVVEPKVEAPIEAKVALAPEAPVVEAQVIPMPAPTATPEAPAVEAQANPVETPASALTPKALTVESQEAPTTAPTETPVQKPIRAREPAASVAQTQFERETWADETRRTMNPTAVASTPAQTATLASAPIAAAAPQPTVKVVRKAAQSPSSRVKTADRGYGAPREGYQSRIHREYGIPRETIRSGMSALRARDPQLAAMIARYM